MTEIHGYRQKLKTRCDYCHRTTDYPYIVKSGPTTGKFCSAQHFNLAKQAMEENKVPGHEVKESQ